jgi:hypothetical protein
LLRQFIEALAYRRFDLSGGPRKFYQFRIDDNVTGWFGRQIPEECKDKACRDQFPHSKYKLVDDPEEQYSALKDMTTGRCFGNPDNVLEDLSDEEIAKRNDLK